MCACLSFLTEHPVIVEGWTAWKQALRRLFSIRAWPLLLPGEEVELFNAARLESPRSPARASSPRRHDGSLRTRKTTSRLSANGTTTKQEKSKDQGGTCSLKSRKKELKRLVESKLNGTVHERFASNGGNDLASLFTKKGLKGINQDAMLVWEGFASREDTIFCGVFDGHGPHGHLVARNVRDILPLKLASCWQDLHRADEEAALSPDGMEDGCASQIGNGFVGRAPGDPHLITSWKESFLDAYKLMDRELLVDDSVDCVSSGTTAVTLVKQGNDLIVGNVGDSRAVLGTRADDHSLLALQLTVDLRPNLPKEAERIRRCKGRVFALRDEPSVKRVWLPHLNAPGLAMARALGDYCLKTFGVISVPEVTYRQLTEKDKFIVLATDGVWDVLSNDQVVEIVASVPIRSAAANAVVDTAVHAWRSKYPTSRVDDCAVVCLFLDNITIVSTDCFSKKGS